MNAKKKPVEAVDVNKAEVKKPARSDAEILKDHDIDASKHQPILRKVERGLYTLDQAIEFINAEKE